jgi:hypothetical protein
MIAAALTATSCGGGPSDDEKDRAVDAAMKAYQEAKASGVDLEVGPCIAEHLPGAPGWVADVAHEPREDVDDDPANQCQSYRSGDAEHFVELTPDGELIRAE